jgi:hypothetical protein
VFWSYDVTRYSAQMCELGNVKYWTRRHFWQIGYVKFLNTAHPLWCISHKYFFPPMARQPYMGLGLLVSSRLHHHTHMRHTTVGRTPLDEGPARRKDLYLTTHNTHKRQISMPPVAFEPTILVSERPKTHALRPWSEWRQHRSSDIFVRRRPI